MVPRKTVTIIQARLGSSRFPRKVLERFGGSTLLESCYLSCQEFGWPICVAVADYELASFCWKKGWSYYFGSENDVLDRYYQAAKMMKADWICRVTSDQPRVILAQLIPFWALREAWEKAKTSHEREHVDPWLVNLTVDTKEDLMKLRRLYGEEEGTLEECGCEESSCRRGHGRPRKEFLEDCCECGEKIRECCCWQESGGGDLSEEAT